MVTSINMVWHRFYPYPFHYGFCPSEAAWNKELKRLKIKHLPYPTAYGYCYQIHKQGDLRGNVAVVFADDEASKDKKIEAVGLLIHEATHVWQFLLETIGEENPSVEFEAYGIQSITMDLIVDYEKTRNQLLRK